MFAKRKHHFLRSILISVFFFFYIFMPPILKCDIHIILLLCAFIVSIIICLFQRKIVFDGVILKAVFGFIPFILIFLITQLAHSFEDPSHYNYIFSSLKSILNLFIRTGVICFAVYIIYGSNGMNIDNFICDILNAAIIEFILVLISFLFPTIRSIFLETMIKNSSSEIIAEAIQQDKNMRCYGFADNLYDSFGYITSLIISLTFLRGLERRKTSFLLISFALLIMPLLNTRSGLLLSFVAITIICVCYVDIKNIPLLIGLGLGIFFVCVLLIKYLPANLKEWIDRGVKETVTLVSGGGAEGTYGEILGADLQYPKDVFWGVGYSPEVLNMKGIDSGYVQCIWRFGLIGTLALFFGILYYIFTFISASKSKQERVALIVLLVIFSLYMFKLYGVGNNGANLILYGLPIVTTAHKKTQVPLCILDNSYLVTQK